MIISICYKDSSDAINNIDWNKHQFNLFVKTAQSEISFKAHFLGDNKFDVKFNISKYKKIYILAMQQVKIKKGSLVKKISAKLKHSSYPYIYYTEHTNNIIKNLCYDKYNIEFSHDSNIIKIIPENVYEDYFIDIENKTYKTGRDLIGSDFKPIEIEFNFKIIKKT